MMAEQLLKSDVGSRVKGPATTKSTRVLIPVDFTDSSYQALAYALKLVKVFNGIVDLFHVVDIAEVAESDNPVVVKRWIENREKESSSRIQSLREMIGESHVDVSSCIVVTGNKRTCLLKQIQEVNPDLIVLGKGDNANSLVSFITENSTCPVLVVPSSATPVLPSLIALAANKGVITEDSLSPFFKIVEHTTRSFSVLSARQEKSANEKNPEIYFNGYDFRVSYIESQDVVNYIIQNQVDLLCTIRRKQTFFERFFQRNNPLEMINKVSVPVLILGEAA